ncbi:MAG: hypothetical protein AMXMBFR64_23460 [Myxococcales bacterium]
MSASFPLDRLTAYLRQRLGHDVEVLGVRALSPSGGTTDVKGLGYGVPLLVELRRGHTTERLVLETVRPGAYGHEHMADRAQGVLWAYDAFNRLPGHVEAVDVGAVMQDGSLLSLAGMEEPFIVTRFVEGHPYNQDLERLRDGEALDEDAIGQADTLCDALIEVHAERRDDPSLYRRHVRDLIGHGEGIFGVVDAWPVVRGLGRLEAIERALVWWRWRLRAYEHRLRRVHGDFHPWNLMFDEGRLTMLDRSRGEWGEPANDVTCITANYLFFALQAHGRLRGPLERLWSRFWWRYVERTGDRELLQVAPPFLAFRCLVMASPAWYPTLDEGVRDSLLRLAAGALAGECFDPARAAAICEGRDE